MVSCHSKTLLSSTSPAENPSTRFFARSATINQQGARDQEPIAANRGDKGGENREAFGFVPLSCFPSKRLAWLAMLDWRRGGEVAGEGAARRRGGRGEGEAQRGMSERRRRGARELGDSSVRGERWRRERG